MNETVLKDNLGKRIGTIRTDHNGVQTLYDALSKRLGTYDPRTNVTKDHLSRRVGTGNLLTSLLH